VDEVGHRLGYVRHQACPASGKRADHVSRRSASSATLAAGTTFGGFMFVFALATQGDAHLSPVMGALTLLPIAAAFMVVSADLPRNERRWGPRTLVGTVYLTLAARRPTGHGLVAVCLLVSAVSLAGIPLSLRLGRVAGGAPARR